MKKIITQLMILLALVVVLSMFYVYNKRTMNTPYNLGTINLNEPFTLSQGDSVRIGDLVVTYVSIIWLADLDLGPRYEIAAKKDGEDQQSRVFLNVKDPEQSYKEFTITLEYSSDTPLGIPAGVPKKESAYIGLRVTLK